MPEPVLFDCDVCGESYNVFDSKAYYQLRYCSVECEDDDEETREQEEKEDANAEQ